MLDLPWARRRRFIPKTPSARGPMAFGSITRTVKNWVGRFRADGQSDTRAVVSRVCLFAWRERELKNRASRFDPI